MTELREGDTAPEFTLPSTGGGSVSLSDLRGRDVLLYFYPKDDTPGCTKEACSFRDAHEDIERADTVVLGVSPDDLGSHERFTATYHLPFTLLADTDHAVAESYGVWKERRNYGKTYMGIDRSTFLIGADGKIKKVWRSVKPDRHVAQVLQAVTS